MTKVIDESAASRNQLKAQFEQEIASVRAACEQEHAARIDGEQALASMRDAGGRQLQELDDALSGPGIHVVGDSPVGRCRMA
eukprot:6465277-Amphidinium_carterae.1